MGEGAVLRADALGVAGPQGPLLADVTLEAHAGRVLAVTGSSGSGKTTLLSVLGGLVRPDCGAASFAGQPVGTRTGEPRTGTAFVLQSYGLVPSLTAEENVAIALRTRKVKPGDDVRRAHAALARVGVADLAERLVTELSGGQLQRVAVARALAVEPDVLLADEPTSQLSHDDRDAMVELIHVVNRELGTTVVLVTHDPEVAAMCDEELHLVDGRLVDVPVAVGESGPAHEHDLFRRPR